MGFVVVLPDPGPLLLQPGDELVHLAQGHRAAVAREEDVDVVGVNVGGLEGRAVWDPDSLVMPWKCRIRTRIYESAFNILLCHVKVKELVAHRFDLPDHLCQGDVGEDARAAVLDSVGAAGAALKGGQRAEEAILAERMAARRHVGLEQEKSILNTTTSRC